MLRRWYTGLGAALLAVASLQAPLAHVHPQDPDHHHAHGLAHAHLPALQHDAEGPEWEPHDDDESTIYLEWAPAAAERVVVAYAEAPFAISSRPTLVRCVPAPEFEAQSHSPPQPRLLPARAPPV
jgi:hypothetical protein